MEKIKKLLFIFIALILCQNKVVAACDASLESKIRSEAYGIQTSYEITKIEDNKEDVTPPDGVPVGDDFIPYITVKKIHIQNITENLYVEVYDDEEKETKKYTYADTENGHLTLINYNLELITKYRITVYSNTDCLQKVKIRTMEVKTPMFNELRRDGLCSGVEEYYLCHEYIDYDINLSFEEAVKKIDEYREAKNKQEEQKKEEKNDFGKFLENNKKTIIIISVVIIILGVGITVVVIKLRRRVI